jgi:4-amino-4-deoxy-L-arabinose transferase-like glycosyltransferase
MRRDRLNMLAAVAAVFVVALGCRLSLPYRPHNEGDERIYRALVEQWDAGRGHTLQGHALLQEPGTDRVQYGQKLFFHPPGGIALFWAGHRLFGERGFLLVELASFALFFGAVVVLAALVIEPFGILEALLAAILAGFSPIMLHVTAHYWLDGPVLALSTLAAAFAVWGLRRESPGWMTLAGVALGAAALVKPTAFLVVPGLAALAVARRPLSVKQAAIVLGCAAATFAPWLIWRWQVMGTPFPGWAGKPTQNLATLNPYVHYVTVIRKPWVYLGLLPRVHATLLPACLLGIAQWRRPALRRVSLALIVWIAFIVLVHVALGYLGFSKVLRYVILVSPAVIVLFVAQAGAAWRERERRWVLLALAAAGLMLEIVQGVRTMAFGRDLILPWPFGL